MPKFAELDFRLKRGRSQLSNDKGMPIFATEADYTAPAVISEIIPGQLFLSDKVSAETWKQEIKGNSKSKKVILVINKEDDQPLLRQEGQFLFLNLPDGGSVNPFASDTFDQIYNFIESNIQTGNQVLVHCSSGASRSPTIVIAYLMRKYGLTFESALYHVGACRRLAEPSSFKEHLDAYQQALGITEPFTLLNFLLQHRNKLLLIGLGILVLTSLIALSIAFPPGFLISVVGSGILGSGGALATSLSLGSLSALGLFGVIGGGLAVTAAILFSLVTLDIYQAEVKSHHSLLGKASTNVATTTATAPAVSNAATAVFNASGSAPIPATGATVVADALITSKPPLMPSRPNDVTSGVSSAAVGPDTHSDQTTASATPAAKFSDPKLG